MNYHYKKKIAKLRYRDEILELHEEGLGVRAIAQKINYRLVRSRIKATLSKSTISNIIKEYHERNN